jgi:hypothetical protein
MRVVFGGKEKLTKKLTTRDVVLVPNLFDDFEKGEIYKKLVDELDNCGIPKEHLLKLWHGNETIAGTHMIADDRSGFKNRCPTFLMIVERLKSYFEMDVKASRLNWYEDTSQWKPMHKDSSAVNPEKAKIQNFTVAVSFGVTRDVAFECASSRTVISIPQGDGEVYAFCKDANVKWRHGILQDMPVRREGRISIICWGSVNY